MNGQQLQPSNAKAIAIAVAIALVVAIVVVAIVVGNVVVGNKWHPWAPIESHPLKLHLGRHAVGVVAGIIWGPP